MRILHIILTKIASIGKFFMWKMKNGCERKKRNEFEWYGAPFRMVRCMVEVFSSHFSVRLLFFSTSSIHFLACNDVNCHDTSTCTCICISTCICIHSANPMCVDFSAKNESNFYAHIVIPVLGLPIYFFTDFIISLPFFITFLPFFAHPHRRTWVRESVSALP